MTVYEQFVSLWISAPTTPGEAILFNIAALIIALVVLFGIFRLINTLGKMLVR